MNASTRPSRVAVQTVMGDPGRVRRAWMCDVDSLAEDLGVDPRVGLRQGEVAARLERAGPNRLADPIPASALRQLAEQFHNPLAALLAVAAVVAALVGHPKDALVVSVVLIINGILGFLQERKADNAMAALRQMLETRARVRREGRVEDIDAGRLVPGDVVLLEAGDRIPADGRFVETTEVLVDESSMTGESLPVEKSVPALDDAELGLADRINVGYMNTTLVAGRAVLLVTTTGPETEMGRVSELINAATPKPTPLQRQLDRLGRRLAAVAMVAVAAVFGLRLMSGAGFGDAMLDAVALAVAAVPEGLPAVVTVTLAVGMRQMALHHAIVKRLSSVETLGSTTVICSDKTGTLTCNEMTARVVLIGHQHYDVTGQGYAADGEIEAPERSGVRPPEGERRELVDALLPVALCNNATVRDGTLLGEPTEGALVALAGKAGIEVDLERENHARIDELPFDSSTKRMATLHALGSGDLLLCVKGAPDRVLDRCTSWRTDATTKSLSEADRRQLLSTHDHLAADGMRVIACASRKVAAEDHRQRRLRGNEEQYLNDLTLDAVVGIIDPPRPEARKAIELCHRAGVTVKMITGDHPATAAAVAAELGIEGDVITGPEIERLSDDELSNRINDIGTCARVSPEHKVRVVHALAAHGHIVAMTGDGVNDAAALRAADIGIAMGVNGTEVTKQAADMVLTDDNFATIVAAIERGRAIYDNIAKFVRFQLTTNLAAIGTLLAAGMIGMPSPLTAAQLLWVNIIADGPPAMSLGMDPPSGHTMHRPPRSPGDPILDTRRVLALLAPASVMTVGTLATLTTATATWGQPVGLTMAFTTFVLFQLCNALNARTTRESVLARDTFRNKKLWASLAVVAALQVVAVMAEPAQSIFGTTSLTLAQWGVCLVTAPLVIVAEEMRKGTTRFISRHRRNTT